MVPTNLESVTVECDILDWFGDGFGLDVSCLCGDGT